MGSSPGEQPEHGPVLVVDDDASVRRLFARVLELAGLPTLEAADGRTALELVAGRRVGAVLLDSTMPGLDGLQTLAALRARPQSRTLPVILVTGRVDIDDRVQGLEAGANDYLIKPVDPDELVARVRAQLRGQAAWMRVLEGQLHERATVAEALCRMRAEATPERTAAVICQELAGLRGVACAALVAFTADRRAVLLGLHGACGDERVAGRPLPDPLTRHLRVRARRGPWTELPDRQPPGTLGVPLADPAAPVAAYAPLRRAGALLGVLVVSAEPATVTQPADPAGALLAAAIDFAAVAAALLAPALEQWGQVETLRARLHEVIDSGAFTPNFQPVIDLDAGTVAGFEILTRFHDGTPPQRCFADAAQAGLRHSLEAATMAAALEAAGSLPDHAWVGVNVSPQTLLAGEPLARLVGGSQRPVVLELTEHDRIDDYPAVRSAVARLGSGVRLSVDDAGAGYACLHHILALKPAFVKLDRTWVSRIEADPARQALVAGLGSFAARTGCRLIAEGIETPAELEALVALDVELGQGYLLGRPAPVAGG